jgi:hypothetical protein
VYTSGRVKVSKLDVIARYREEIGWSTEEDNLFRGVVRRAADLRGTTIPLVGVHGDFWMGNLLVGHGRVRSVVDWEQSQVSARRARRGPRAAGVWPTMYVDGANCNTVQIGSPPKRSR